MIRGDVAYTGKHAIALETLIAKNPAMNAATARDVAQLIVEGNRIDRLLGIDPSGQPLRPTQVRVGRYEGASGPPLAPFGEASASIAAFYARSQTSVFGWTVTAGFNGPMGQILKYHAEGKAGLGHPITRAGQLVGFKGIPGRVTGIRRDVMGVSRRTMEEVRYVIGRQKLWFRDVLRGLPWVSSGYSKGPWR